jgi:hypothetical protein
MNEGFGAGGHEWKGDHRLVQNGVEECILGVAAEGSLPIT